MQSFLEKKRWKPGEIKQVGKGVFSKYVSQVFEAKIEEKQVGKFSMVVFSEAQTAVIAAVGKTLFKNVACFLKRGYQGGGKI